MRKDWIECALAIVCEKALKVKRNEMPLSDKIKYVDIGSIDNNLNQIISHKNYSWEDAPSRAQQIIKKGDVLFSTVRTYLKNIAKVTNETYQDEICSSGFTVLRAKKNVLDSDYLFFRSISTEFLNSLSKLQTGTSYPAVRDKDVFAQIIPLPSFVEQKAIVKKIEELFSSLDSGIADLKKAQEQLVIYRQAVLKKAFEGDYTTKKIIEIADVNTGATPKRENSKFWENGTISWVTSTVVNNEFVNEPSELITEEAIKQTNCKLIPKGSLLIAMYGEGKTRGKCSELNIDTATNQALAGITLFEEYQDSKKFVKWFFVKNYEEIRLLSSGGVQPNLNLSIIKNTLIPFPERKQQINIIREIESRLSVCDKVEESIKEGLLKAEALRQSILKKAFEGTLLSEEEIATCKADRDYEPASVLLEKIKAGNKN